MSKSLSVFTPNIFVGRKATIRAVRRESRNYHFPAKNIWSTGQRLRYLVPHCMAPPWSPNDAGWTLQQRTNGQNQRGLQDELAIITECAV